MKREITKIGRKLNEARTERDYSLQELADRIGVSPSYLSKVEAGNIKEPAGAILIRLARVFGWTMEELYECCVSEEECRIDQQIKQTEAELTGSPSVKLVIEGCSPLRTDLRGKKYYLALLQELKTRSSSP